MKKAVLIPIIIGSALLVTGGIFLAIGVAGSAEVSKRETHEVAVEEAFNNIDIDLSITDVEFKVSEDSKTKVVFEQNQYYQHTTEVKDNKLLVRFNDTRKWYQKIFTFDFQSIKATFYLSNTTYGELKMENSTGNLIIPNNFTFDSVNLKASTGNVKFNAKVNNNLTLKLSTGNVTLDGTIANNITGEVSTGNYNLKNVTVAEKIYLKSSTGKINLTDVTAKDLELKASTGDMKLTNTIIANHIEIKTSTGDITFVDSDADTLNIETDTGDVKGTLLTSKIFSVKGEHVSVPESTTGGLCKIKTDTGTVKITIKG